jgi:hypothetical protein
VSDFVDVREPQTEKLLFRYDPDRDIIEVQRRGVKTVVDLRQYQERQGAPIWPEATDISLPVRMSSEAQS